MAVQQKYNIKPDFSAPGVIDERNPFNTGSFIVTGDETIAENEIPFGVFVQKGDGGDLNIKSSHLKMSEISNQNKMILVGVSGKNLGRKNDDESQGIYADNDNIDSLKFSHREYDQIEIIRQGYVYVYCESDFWEKHDHVYIKFDFEEIDGLKDVDYPIGSVCANNDLGEKCFIIHHARFAENSSQKHVFGGKRLAKIYLDTTLLPTYFIDNKDIELEIDISNFDDDWEQVKALNFDVDSVVKITDSIKPSEIVWSNDSEIFKAFIYGVRDDLKLLKQNLGDAHDLFFSLITHKKEIEDILNYEIEKYSHQSRKLHPNAFAKIKKIHDLFVIIDPKREKDNLDKILLPLFLDDDVSWSYKFFIDYIDGLTDEQLNDASKISNNILPHLEQYNQNLIKILHRQGYNQEPYNILWFVDQYKAGFNAFGELYIDIKNCIQNLEEDEDVSPK